MLKRPKESVDCDSAKGERHFDIAKGQIIDAKPSLTVFGGGGGRVPSFIAFVA